MPLDGSKVEATQQTIDQLHRRRDTCRVCEQDALEIFLSLGPMPLANAFLASPNDFGGEQRYPLDLALCSSCSHVQLVDVIDPAALFNEYLYLTGTSETMNSHNRQHATALLRELDVGSSDLVVELASNDGSFLRLFQPAGARLLGIEPATNIAAMANKSGVETLSVFFDSDSAVDIVDRYGPARLVIAKNVLAHVDDPRDFLLGCARLMESRGVTVIEVPYLADMIRNGEYDTVYHEHLSYFSISALMRLAEGAGLVIDRVDRHAIHGGSLRLMLKGAAAAPSHCDEALTLAAAERNAGLYRVERYKEFAADAVRNRAEVRDALERFRSEGRSIAAYGAPAKGNTLLNWCGIDTTLVEFTVDRNPLKVGKFTPGMHIPVLPVSTLAERQPDRALVLPWNLAEEIKSQEREYQARGGRFMIPIPFPQLI